MTSGPALGARRKRFRTTGPCVPGRDYMVDRSAIIAMIVDEYIAPGDRRTFQANDWEELDKVGLKFDTNSWYHGRVVKTFTIEYLPRAAKELAKIDKPMATRIVIAIESLRTDPRPAGAKTLVSTGEYRIRVGDYRVIYTVHDNKLIVLVIKIGHRRDIYDR